MNSLVGELPDEILLVVIECLTWEEKTLLRVNKRLRALVEVEVTWQDRREVMREYWALFIYNPRPLRSWDPEPNKRLAIDMCRNWSEEHAPNRRYIMCGHNTLGFKETVSWFDLWERSNLWSRARDALEEVEDEGPPGPVHNMLSEFVFEGTRPRKRPRLEEEAVNALQNGCGVHGKVLARLIDIKDNHTPGIATTAAHEVA